MLSLFEKYVNEGKIAEALIVGQNMVNRAPGERELFKSYFTYLCTLAERLPSLDERIQFFDQANVVLSFFMENAKLDEETIDEIIQHQTRLDAIQTTIQDAQEAKRIAEAEEIRRKNDALLKKLYSLKDKLLSAGTKEDFDQTLKEIRSIDQHIETEKLTEMQSDVYDDLVKENTEIMSEKLRELERIEKVDYNKEAVEAFRKAFKEFQGNENKYTNQEQLRTLASTTLFAYDAAKLFNETLIYYNHVYSYIFSKLNPDGQLALTRCSIECERNQR